jgi:hypothetical protein
MNLRSLTGENFALDMHMPQMFWRGFRVLYDHTLPEERRAAMLNLIDAHVLSSNGGRVPSVERIELHAAAEAPAASWVISDEGSTQVVKGYVVVILEKMTKVFEYEVEDGKD